MSIRSREPGTVRGTARRPHFSLAFISVTVQLWIEVFWVISVQFDLRNILPKFCPFLLGHPVYIQVHIRTDRYNFLYGMKHHNSHTSRMNTKTFITYFWTLEPRTNSLQDSDELVLIIISVVTPSNLSQYFSCPIFCMPDFSTRNSS